MGSDFGVSSGYLEGYTDLKDDERIDLDFKEYFTKLEQLKSIDRQIAEFEIYIRDLQHSIKTSSFGVDDSLPTPKTDDIVSSSRNIQSYIEQKFISQIDELEKQVRQYNRELFRLKSDRNKIILSISNINVFYNMLHSDFKKILTYKFYDNKTLLEIGIENNCSEATIRKKIKKIRKSYNDYCKSIFV